MITRRSFLGFCMAAAAAPAFVRAKSLMPVTSGLSSSLIWTPAKSIVVPDSFTSLLVYSDDGKIVKYFKLEPVVDGNIVRLVPQDGHLTVFADRDMVIDRLAVHIPSFGARPMPMPQIGQRSVLAGESITFDFGPQCGILALA